MTTSDSKEWKDLTPEEKMDARFAGWQNPPIPFASPEAEEAYKARVLRLTRAMRLDGTPDRVPVPLFICEMYPAYRAGLTPYEMMYDVERAAKAFIDFNVEFQPDAMVHHIAATPPGQVLDIVNHKLWSWPGHDLPKENDFQYNEGEWMKAEDYQALIDDPSFYLIRTYLPRVLGGLDGFAKIGSPCDCVAPGLTAGFCATFAEPELIASLEKLSDASKAATVYMSKALPGIFQMMTLGFPFWAGGLVVAPFDFLGNFLRGTRQILMDIYRRPEKVVEACERLVPIMIRWALDKANMGTPPLILIPLHKGADGFMSLDQFKTFYWPTLKKVMLGLVDEGFMPVAFAEGGFDSRLETIMDYPKGKAVWIFDRTDMAAAKATVGKVAAIQGNVPLSLLLEGTPDQVTEYCRKLIEVAAPGGGFLLDMGAGMHQGKDEGIRAMIQAAKDYGVY